MNEGTTSNERTRAWVTGWITVTLSIAASIATSLGVWLALSASDTEPLESPLLLSVARQLDHGPWGLYGPFGRQNPLVLIHAPLYYHVAAILARPLRNAGLDAITAARLAGRALSFVGLLLTAWSAFRIARLDRAPARAGWWAACLIATAPVVGAIPYTVRPDMIGIAVQTTGVLLVLKRLDPNAPAAWRSSAASLRSAWRFASSSISQADVSPRRFFWSGPGGAGQVSRGWWGSGCSPRPPSSRRFMVIEELATEGRMSQAVFVAAPATIRVHPADRIRFGIVLATIAGESLCLIALLAVAGLAQVASKRRTGRTAAAVLGTSLVGFALFMPIVHAFRPSMVEGLATNSAVLACLFLVVPGLRASSEPPCSVAGSMRRYVCSWPRRL